MQIETGLGVLHLFLSPVVGRAVDTEAVTAAIKTAEAAEAQVITAALLGHKADVAVMALHRDWSVLRRLQTDLQAAGLDVVDSYVSITEVSEYAKGMPEHMLNERLYPSLPPADKPIFCFYPMTKRREAHANWYATPYEQRNEMMREHGKSGRTFAGKVVQLITGVDRARRLRVGRDAVRDHARGRQGRRLHDALRQGLGPLRRVRPVLRRLPRAARRRRSTHRGAADPAGPVGGAREDQ